MNIRERANQAPDHIMTMPIHAVTEMLGTEGLETRFAKEVVQAFDNPRVILKVEESYNLAATLHAEDKRSREPAVNHLLRGTIRCLSSNHLGVKDPYLAVGYPLHDSVEDHPWELADVGRDVSERRARFLALGNIALRFGASTAEMVGSMTNPLLEEGEDHIEPYLEHLNELVDFGPWRGVVGKLSDAENMTGLFWAGDAPKEKYVRWATKYAPAVPILRRALQRQDLRLSPDAVKYMHIQLDLAADNCAKILAA